MAHNVWLSGTRLDCVSRSDNSKVVPAAAYSWGLLRSRAGAPTVTSDSEGLAFYASRPAAGNAGVAVNQRDSGGREPESRRLSRDDSAKPVLTYVFDRMSLEVPPAAGT
jgi:hypothetical protein